MQKNEIKYASVFSSYSFLHLGIIVVYWFDSLLCVHVLSIMVTARLSFLEAVRFIESVKPCEKMFIAIYTCKFNVVLSVKTCEPR